MEADKGVAVGGVGESCSSSRQRFFIELRPDETTIVSWKRLVKYSNPSAPASLQPASTSSHKTCQPNAAKDECSDDGLLMMYQNGFLLDTEKLEQKNEPDLSANHESQKWRRKRVKTPGEKVDDHMHRKLVKLGHARLKVAATNPPIVGNCSIHSKNLFCSGELDSMLDDRSSSPVISSMRKPTDIITKSEHSCTEISKASDFPLSLKDTINYRTGNNHQSDADYSLSSGTTYEKSQEINSSDQLELPGKQTTISDEVGIPTEVGRWEKKTNCEELPDLNIPVSPLPAERSPSTFLKDGPVQNNSSKDGSSLRPKGTVLERAIREFEKVVAQWKPPTFEIQDAATSSTAIKKRLPGEVKQKLAKVARLASSQGKISEKLVNRLMSILGNSMQLRTLKRNLREMVSIGLLAKQEKADKFIKIKEEIIEMIRSQGSKQIDKATNDLMGILGAGRNMIFEEKYSIDVTMEDKIFDLYDIYVQGMDEDKGPQIRKLYAELAELWPNGTMDTSGIKGAIRRAKKRRRVLHDYEKVPRKGKEKKSTPKMEVIQAEASSSAHIFTKEERSKSVSDGHILALPCKRSYLRETPDLQLGAPVDISGLSLKSSNLSKQEKHEKFTLPSLTEQKQQQQREFEGRVKKPSLKLEDEAQKSS